MRHLDLFSGIGGFTLAAGWAGIETMAFCEKDPFCKKILAKHWAKIPIHDDVKTFHWKEEVDLITGGFPCQPFSVAGKRKGKNDDRYLWPEFLRIIRECEPNWVVAENVTGIVAMELDNILADLENEGYETQSFVIPACSANAPHRRDRVWIVANRNSKRRNVWTNYWKKGHLQKNIVGDMAAFQSEWEKLKPKSWQTFTATDWLSINAQFSRSHDGISGRLDRDRIKALGNAIVPQVVYSILATIKLIEDRYGYREAVRMVKKK